MTTETSSSVQLHFGKHCQWELHHRSTLTCMTGEVPATVDLHANMVAALENSLGLSSLDQVIVPGDVVALAVDPAVPSLPEAVGHVARWLCERGTAPANLKVVIASHEGGLAEVVRAGLERILGSVDLDASQIAIETHDADDPQRLAYVAANEASDPIYINRTLVDADVVIPIGCTRHASHLDYLGAFSLFPLLSNRETLGMFFQLRKLEEPSQRASLQSWADQAAWWLGLLASIQVVPAAGDGVAAVFSGLMEQVESASQEAFEQLWKAEVAPSDLVVALLDNNASQQSWRGVMRSLWTATRFVKPGGTIVLCTELQADVGRPFKRLTDVHDSREAIARKLDKDDSDDALPAAVILQATADYHVYLASGLRPGIVENMGMGAIATAEQLAHLVGQHPAWAVLSSAQHRF